MDLLNQNRTNTHTHTKYALLGQLQHIYRLRALIIPKTLGKILSVPKCILCSWRYKQNYFLLKRNRLITILKILCIFDHLYQKIDHNKQYFDFMYGALTCYLYLIYIWSQRNMFMVFLVSKSRTKNCNSLKQSKGVSRD